MDVVDWHKELSVIFTKVNLDMDGRSINRMIDEFVVGDRQKGWVCAESVINFGNNAEEIENAFQKALSCEFKDKIANIENPYEKRPAMRLLRF